MDRELCSTEGEMIHISTCNKKMGKDIPSFSLVPGEDCMNSKFCYKRCYARRMCARCPRLMRAWRRNSDLWKTDSCQVEREVEAYLKENKPKFFRWFVGGDIPDYLFFNLIVEIAKRYPDTKFLCFTKAFDYVSGRTPENLSIVLSLFPGMTLPKRLARFPVAFSGPQEGKRSKKALECSGSCENCHMCWHLKGLKRDVRFDFH